LELRKMSVRQAAEAVCSGETTARQLIEQTLKNCSVLNEGLNIFTQIAGVDAIEQAKAVDRLVENGKKPPLAGVPFAVKDDICYGVLPTSFGSEAFKEFMSPHTATVVERLMDAGAIAVGKTNLDDMSLGSTTTSSPYGPSVSPWGTGLAAGSAGAAAVASGVSMFALESDSGGALRQGASHCGVAGLRPTPGRISRSGLNLFAPSFGQVGITAFSSENVKQVLALIEGFDKRDAATAAWLNELTGHSKALDLENITIGYPLSVFDHLEPALREMFERLRNEYLALGFTIRDLEMGMLREALRAYYIISAAEASSNHARFDGIRFGKAPQAESLDDLYFKSRGNILGKEARRRSIFGTLLLSEGNYDRYYRQALKVWQLVKKEFNAALSDCDLLLLPAVKKLPRSLQGEKSFLEEWEEDLFCAPVSLAGLPSLCLPAGQLEELPVGAQLVGPPFSEETLLDVGARVAR